MNDRQRLYGLVVDSEHDLHQDRPAAPDLPADVVLTWGRPISSTDAPPAGREMLSYVGDRPWYAFSQRPDGGYVLRFHRAVDFEVGPDLRSVEARTVGDVDTGYSVVLATGAMLAFQLYARGQAVLHASAVELGGSAIAFTGVSGQGKSTMAALLCSEGGRLITDDVLRLDVEQEVVRTRLGATELRLRKGADTLVERFAAGRPDRRRSADDRQVIRLDAGATDGVPLGALVVPMPDRSGASLEVRQLHGAEAALAILRYPRLLGWTDPKIQAEQFRYASMIAARVPVLRASIPWGPPFAGDLGVRIVEAVDRAALPVHA